MPKFTAPKTMRSKTRQKTPPRNRTRKATPIRKIRSKTPPRAKNMRQSKRSSPNIVSKAFGYVFDPFLPNKMRVYPRKKNKKSISFSKSNSKNSKKSPSRPYPQANVKTEYFYRNTGRKTTYSRTNIPKENIRKSKTKSKSKTRREYRNKHQQGKFNPNPRSRHTRKQPSPKKQTPKQPSPKKQTPKQPSPKKQTHIPSRNLSPLFKKNGVVINSIKEPNDALSILKLPLNKIPTKKELRKAYLKRSKQLHPDKHKNSKLATEKFKQLKNAYEFVNTRI